MGGIPRKIQPRLRVIEKIFLSWLFSFTESPGGKSASGLWGECAGKGVWGERARECLGGKWQEVLPQTGRDGGHCSKVSSAPAGTPHMPPAGPAWIQSLRELDRWAAVLEKMGLLGCPSSGAKRGT